MAGARFRAAGFLAAGFFSASGFVSAFAFGAAFRRGARFGFSSAGGSGARVTVAVVAGPSVIVMWHIRFRIWAARPRARGRQRLIVGPSSTYAVFTIRSSPIRL